MASRVAITGTGIISAAGLCLAETLDSLIHSTSGIGPVKYLDTLHKDIPCGEVPLSTSELKKLCNLQENEIIARSSLLGTVAANEAIKSAGLSREALSHLIPDREVRIAFINGTTVGGMDITESIYSEILSERTNKSLIIKHGSGTTTLDMVKHLPLDFCYMDTLSTACSAAANAIAEGAELLKCGRADIVIAGGCECLTKYHLNGFNSLMILDSKPCRPFDATRNGLNLGEGAGFLVLENEEFAKTRGASPKGILAGYANACDAYHQTATSPNGDGAVITMRNALKKSGLNPEQIDYINAHGTGTSNNDLSEGRAIDIVFGNKVPPVSSTKGLTGHPTSAAGAIEAVISLLSVEHGFIPANHGFKEKMPEISFEPVRELRRNVTLKNVLSNSFGFGGNDTSLIFSSYNQNSDR